MVRASRLSLIVKISALVAGILFVSLISGSARGTFVESSEEAVSLTSTHGSYVMWTNEATQNESEWNSRFKVYSDLTIWISGPVSWEILDLESNFSISGTNGIRGNTSMVSIQVNGTPLWIKVRTEQIGSNVSKVFNFGRLIPTGTPLRVIDKAEIPMIALSLYWSMIYRVLIWTGIGLIVLLVPITMALIRYKRGRVVVR